MSAPSVGWSQWCWSWMRWPWPSAPRIQGADTASTPLLVDPVTKRRRAIEAVAGEAMPDTPTAVTERELTTLDSLRFLLVAPLLLRHRPPRGDAAVIRGWFGSLRSWQGGYAEHEVRELWLYTNRVRWGNTDPFPPLPPNGATWAREYVTGEFESVLRRSRSEASTTAHRVPRQWLRENDWLQQLIPRPLDIDDVHCYEQPELVLETSGALTALRVDLTRQILWVQLCGTSRWWLAAPRHIAAGAPDVAAAKPSVDDTLEFGVRHPELYNRCAYPKWGDVRCLEVLVRPGDVLVVPRAWIFASHAPTDGIALRVRRRDPFASV